MSDPRRDDADGGATDPPDPDDANDANDANDAEASSTTSETTDDREWRFALDEVGEDAEPRGRPEPEPGSPSAENVLFVVLGVAATLVVIGIVLF